MRLRRKSAEDTGVGDDVTTGETGDDVEAAPAPSGPVDAADLDPDTVYIDLGSLLVPADSGLELRLQVEEDSGTVVAALLVTEEGVLEAHAFASSRGGDLWSEVRTAIASDSLERGGTAVEQDGPFGTELYVEMPVQTPEGETVTQQSRVLGCSGPRWFLRATIAGRPAVDAEYAAPFEDAIRRLGVRRGNQAMAPGEPLPLRLPPEAQVLGEAEEPSGTDG